MEGLERCWGNVSYGKVSAIRVLEFEVNSWGLMYVLRILKFQISVGRLDGRSSWALVGIEKTLGDGFSLGLFLRGLHGFLGHGSLWIS